MLHWKPPVGRAWEKKLGRGLKISGIVLAAALAVLGIADKFGVTGFIPGFDSGFDAVISVDRQKLSATLDMGNTECWLRLTIRCAADSPGPSIDVRLGKDKYLEADVRSRADGKWDIVISSAQPGQDPRVFEWPTGWKLNLSEKHGTLLALDGWELHTASKGIDSSQKDRVRTLAQVLWTILLATSILVAGFGVFLEDRQPSGLREEILRAIIRAIEGSNRKETKQMRQLLSKIVFDKATLDEAVSALSLDSLERRILPKRALASFEYRLQLLKEIIQQWQAGKGGK